MQTGRPRSHCWLYGGPGLVAAGRCRLAASARLRDEHAPGCGAVLYLLVHTGQRAAYPDIADVLEGLHLCPVLERLRDVDGVLFLESEPPGLALNNPLKDELTRLLQGG